MYEYIVHCIVMCYSRPTHTSAQVCVVDVINDYDHILESMYMYLALHSHALQNDMS